MIAFIKRDLSTHAAMLTKCGKLSDAYNDSKSDSVVPKCSHVVLKSDQVVLKCGRVV